MKFNLPVLIGGAVVAAALGVLLLWRPPPQPKDLAAPSIEHVRAELQKLGKSEGRDYVIEAPVILSQGEDEMFVRVDVKHAAGEMTRDYHRLLRTDKGWEFNQDLDRSFREFVDREQRAACDRLAKRLVERYQTAVDIGSDKVRIGSRLRESTPTGSTETRVIGALHIQFLDGGGEGRYVEDFSFVKGGWTMEGTAGQLFDRGPRSARPQ